MLDVGGGVLGEGILLLGNNSFVPSKWEVEESRGVYDLQFDPSIIKLYFDEDQEGLSVIPGTDLRKKLEGCPVYGANLLHFYLSHPEFIPWEWKNRNVFFWGTIYRCNRGKLWVACLFWSKRKKKWGHRYRWLGDTFDDYRPAAIFANMLAA